MKLDNLNITTQPRLALSYDLMVRVEVVVVGTSGSGTFWALLSL